MTTGVSTASLFLREMNEDALTVFKDLGVKCTEIFLATFSEYTEEYARLLKERAEGIFVNSVHVLNTQFEPQLFGAHARMRTKFWTASCVPRAFSARRRIPFTASRG